MNDLTQDQAREILDHTAAITSANNRIRQIATTVRTGTHLPDWLQDTDPGDVAEDIEEALQKIYDVLQQSADSS